MIIVDELKEGFNIMVHPDSATQKKRKIGEALLFYYKVSIVPLILYIIFALVVPPTSTDLLTGPVSSSKLVLWGLLFIWIEIPISLFVASLLYHLFGKLFKIFHSPYSNTFTATVYGIVPYILFYWLRLLSVGLLLLIIFYIWSLVILAVALAYQQKTSASKAVGIVIATGIIVSIILIFIGGEAAISSSLMTIF